MTEAPLPSAIPVDLGPCSACKFFDVIDTEKGRCRRDAPSAPAQAGGFAIWPICRTVDWCGEWITAAAVLTA